MKVLFLDIDGVLNSTRTAVAHGGYPGDFSPPDMAKFDETAIALIRRLCLAADASVVLSSSWRIMFSAHEVANALDLPIMDKTPSLPGNRGQEIAHWLDRHPEVEAYAIVDDDSDMLPEQLPFFVQTTHEDGLRFSDYRKLCNLFGINEFNEPVNLGWEQ